MPSNNYSVVKNRLSENKEARKVLENSNHVPLEGLFDINPLIDKFEKGETYTIKAKEIFGDNQLVSFECFIYNNNIECARAMVNVYQPENASEFLE